MEPKVSVVLPNYNGEKYLRESISSVLEQTWQNLELIIVDDASTDRSREIIESFDDKRIIKYYSDKNRHVAYATNIGFEMAEGAYIARIDCDDQWEREKLEKQIRFLEEHPAYGACFSKVNIIDEEGRIANAEHQEIFDMFNDAWNRTQKEWLQFFFFDGNCLCNPSAVIRKEALEAIGKRYHMAYVPAQDFEMWTRLVAKYPIHIMDEKFVKYRWTTGESKISGKENGKEYTFFNVHMLIRKNLFQNLSDEEFTEFFQDQFVHRDSATKIELAYEKAQLLARCAGDDVNFLGLEAYEELLRDPENLKILEEKFGFSLKNFYLSYRIPNFGMRMDIQKRDQRIMELTRELESCRSVLENNEKELDALLHSTSWKVTEPLRKIGASVKKRR